ncbi:hypothetical protein EDD63_1412 [Breznakia blatticola]|uniref:Nudix hydrolase domain-containing protein n=1 Tax=Breznakia blatticola TaxID=1754012 RepID=A0A4R7ZCQ3_9FIRM|nr:NUDIX hydrolase [Breznakia blatticola]TDW13941.1 hypothetical protein EDD63_1412 [Breznakia blatticola]
MNKSSKNIYLFELDSVRNSSAKEIILAHEKMYEEIVNKGHCIVLSLNQLTDSQSFLSLLHDEASYKHVFQLFQLGVLKVANYNYSSPSEYIQEVVNRNIEHLEKGDQCSIFPFIFSGIPVSPNDINELRKIKKALTYNSFEELEDELKRERTSRGNPKIKTPRERKLEYIINYLKMIISISLNLNTYVPNSNKLTTFSELLFYVEHLVLSNQIKTNYPEEVSDAIVLLKKARSKIPQNHINNRSSWISLLNTDQTGTSKIMAKSIIDMVYNYTVQENIGNLLKPYQSIKDITFINDFSNKLDDYYNNHVELGDKFNCNEIDWHYLNYSIPATTKRLFKKNKPNINTIHWDTAYRIRKNVNKIYDWENPISKLISNFSWLLQVLIQFIFFILLSILTFILVVEFEIIADELANSFQFLGNLILTESAFWSSFFTILISAFFLWIIQSFTKIPDVIESIRNIVEIVVDFVRFHIRKINIRFKQDQTKNNKSLFRSNDYSKSKEWMEYEVLVAQNPELFKNIGIFNIERDYKKIVTFETENNLKIGVIYHSPFHTLVVDMVYDENGRPFAYERMLSLSNPGSVAIVEFENRLIILKQFRHSIRDYQYAFVRGFNESGLSNIDNLTKEVYEELGICITQESILNLGLIYPDTGVTNNAANVFYCKTNTFPKKLEKHEGIIDFEILSISEFEKLIHSDVLVDGFTLAAYAKLKALKNNK